LHHEAPSAPSRCTGHSARIRVYPRPRPPCVRGAQATITGGGKPVSGLRYKKNDSYCDCGYRLGDKTGIQASNACFSFDTTISRVGGTPRSPRLAVKPAPSSGVRTGVEAL